MRNISSSFGRPVSYTWLEHIANIDCVVLILVVWAAQNIYTLENDTCVLLINQYRRIM